MTKALLIASCGLLALVIGAKVFENDVEPAPAVFIEEKCTEDKKACSQAEIFLRPVRKQARKAYA